MFRHCSKRVKFVRVDTLKQFITMKKGVVRFAFYLCEQQRTLILKVTTTKYLVTGGAGFIGSHIAEALLDKGESVRIFDNFATGKNQIWLFSRVVLNSLKATYVTSIG